MIAALHPAGPYPVLALGGEQGTAKSTAARVLKRLLDPTVAPLNGSPRDLRDLMVAANNSWVLAFDNVSHIAPDISDVLCSISTGGGHRTRQLYQDDEEYLFDVMRPILMNGITTTVTRGDLLDRALVVTLGPIEERDRKEETVFWAEFEDDAPRIFGALLTAYSFALGNLPRTKLEGLPRMADFAKLASAAEPMLGMKEGEFIERYRGNREDAVETVLDDMPLVSALQKLVVVSGEWTGKSGELLERLAEHATEAQQQSKQWPKSATGLTHELKRVAPMLRQARIVDARYVRDMTLRGWKIRRLADCLEA